jgi:hypothetical protein
MATGTLASRVLLASVLVATSSATVWLGAQVPATNLEIVGRFDANKNGRLDAAERSVARTYLGTLTRTGATVITRQFPAPPPGRRLTSADVRRYGNESLYDPAVLRTLFLEFENPDWEKELADFNNTDVDVPAKLTVDGRAYENVGVHFRGASSYFTVPLGYKHSMNLAMDLVDNDQTLLGYSTLNLLNAHADPSFLRTALYQHIARQYFPAPKVNYVRVVINGESWGIYVNAQQFNSEMVNEWFNTTRGNRWKVQGSPAGRGGLNYLGDDPAAYKTVYRLRTKDNEKVWADLMRLTRVLSQTPLDRLEQEVSPLLDIDGTLKWLAVEKALMNSDGYWVRMSDFNVYQDTTGRFHIISHDANETLREPEGPPRSGPASPYVSPSLGVALQPFEGSQDESKVLLARLVAVPVLRAKYLGYVRAVAEDWMDWTRVGPLANQFRALVEADVRADTHKLYSTAGFDGALTIDNADAGAAGPVAGGLPNRSLKKFFDERRAFLLSHPDLRP